MESLKTEMTDEQKLDLLLSIQETSSSKQWSRYDKEKILKQITDKDFKRELKQAWVNQQLKEVQSDPLEEKVVDESGQCLASRAWKCKVKHCKYQPHSGHCAQLAVAVAAEDHSKLSGKSTKKFACLMHYRVEGQESNYCHNYFKLYKKLPVGAYLKLKIQKQSVQAPNTSTSAAPKGGDSENSLNSLPRFPELVAQKELTKPSVASHGTQTDKADDSESHVHRVLFEATIEHQQKVRELSLKVAKLEAQLTKIALEKEQAGNTTVIIYHLFSIVSKSKSFVL